MPRIGPVLRTPRWIARTVLALAVVAVFVGAAIWQYQRTQDQLTVARAAVAQPAPYADVVAVGAQQLPLEGLGRQVVVRGVVEPGARTFVRSRLSPAEEPGYWVVDGVRLADGRLVAVLQGWVERPAAAPVIEGPWVHLLGRLQPDENFYAGAPVPATGPLLTITAAGLAQQWGPVVPQGGLAPGYVTVIGTAVPGIEPVRPVIGSDPDVAFPLQNAFYSLQWLVFAGVVILVWVRWLREDIADAAAGTEGATGADRDGSADPEPRVSLDR